MNKGRSITVIVIISVFVLSSFLFFIPFATEGQPSVTSYHLSMPGEAMVTNAQGDPVLICGVIYYFNLTLSETVDNLSLNMTFTGNTSAQDHTVKYRFTYDSTGGFADPLYSKYIKLDLSTADDSFISFAIGTHGAAKKGNWDVEIISDGFVLDTYQWEFRQGNVGMSISSPTTLFVVAPMTPQTLSNDYSFFDVANTGNVPSQLTVTLDMFQSEMDITNTSSVFHVGDSRKCEVSFNAPSLLPQKQVFKGNVKARCPIFISGDMVNFIPEISLDFDVIVEVRRSNYSILDLGNAAIQYQRLLSLRYGDTLGTDIYVTGEGPVTIDIGHFNLKQPTIRIDGIGVVSNTNIELDLIEGEEVHITFNVQAGRTDTTAYLNYTTDTGQQTGTASTKIIVTGKPKITYTDAPGPSASLLAAIIILLVVAIGVGFVIFQYRQSAKMENMEHREKEK